MDKKILSYLKSRKNKEIPLMELENLVEGDTEYKDFAMQIKILEEKDILRPVKAHKTNLKTIPLYNTYRINKTYFKDKFIDKIQIVKLQLHPSIDLKAYTSLKEKEWDRDLPYIKKIDKYIQKNGFPDQEVSSPERSYQIIGDEKWIDEKGGRRLLERLKLWEKLKVSYKNDPLMMAINPNEIGKDVYMHMIVENKATFHMFLDLLHETTFTSLIYGAGWKIVSNIVMLEKQLGLEGCYHKLFYFGDIDYEGISIWNALNEKRSTDIAVPFYKSLMNKPFTKGKENQRRNEGALNNFLEYFNDNERKEIKTLLNSKGYYPQEGLKKEEIKAIWRNGGWTHL